MRTPWFGMVLLVSLGCAAAPSELDDEEEPDWQVTEPYPIDGVAGAIPPKVTYKGLPLRLTDTGEPTVTPVDGVIGVVCVGMSNAAQECGDFISRRQGEFAAELNPAVRVANCAVGGHAIERWIDPAFDAVLWQSCLTSRLPQAGVRPDQVRVLYHKAANQFTLGPDGRVRPPYPDPASDYFVFQANLTAFSARVRAFFPAVQAVYTTSRSYGGFASNPGRGEPLSYEEGHALNQWLVARPGGEPVWHGWGPYIWAPACASGLTNGGGICYDRPDYQADGVHPAEGARRKISHLLHRRFRAHGWYRAPGS